MAIQNQAMRDFSSFAGLVNQGRQAQQPKDLEDLDVAKTATTAQQQQTGQTQQDTSTLAKATTPGAINADISRVTTAGASGGTVAPTANTQGQVVVTAGKTPVDTSNWSQSTTSNKAASSVPLTTDQASSAFNPLVNNADQGLKTFNTLLGGKTADQYAQDVLSAQNTQTAAVNADAANNVAALNTKYGNESKNLQDYTTALNNFINQNTHNLGQTAANDPMREKAISQLQSLASQPGTSNIDVASALQGASFNPQYGAVESAILGGGAQNVRNQAALAAQQYGQAQTGTQKSIEDYLKTQQTAQTTLGQEQSDKEQALATDQSKDTAAIQAMADRQISQINDSSKDLATKLAKNDYQNASAAVDSALGVFSSANHDPKVLDSMISALQAKVAKDPSYQPLLQRVMDAKTSSSSVSVGGLQGLGSLNIPLNLNIGGSMGGANSPGFTGGGGNFF